MKFFDGQYSPYETSSFKSKGTICPICGESAEPTNTKGRNKSKCENQYYRHYIENGKSYILEKR